jgi:serpin B
MQYINRKYIALSITLLFAITSWAQRTPEGDLNALIKLSDQKAVDPAIGNNQFAFEMYNELSTKKQNFFFSPYSISAALAMTYGGARGETAQQMSKALHFEINQKKFHPKFQALSDTLLSRNRRGMEFKIANKLWAEKEFTFLDSYFELTKKYYGAALEKMNFKTAAEAARLAINKWVEDQTNDKIKDLLKPKILSKDTRLVLTNAIYFKGSWANEFDKKNTREGNFLADGEKLVKADFMNKYKSQTKYFENDLVKIIDLPYKGDELSMTILLPQKNKGLPFAEQALNAENFANWVGALRQEEVNISLPKFKMTSDFSLKELLSQLGMPIAFVRGVAEFKGMTGENNLFISAVIHKAFVEVNEEGTEAAAATAVIMDMVDSVQIDLTKEFKADHPFVFMIRDTKTGCILFTGRVIDPTI